MFDGIRNRFAGKDASFHFIDKDFGLSNAIEDPKLNELRQTILKVAKQQHYWGELKPARWILLEKMLEDVRKRNVEVVFVTYTLLSLSKVQLLIYCTWARGYKTFFHAQLSGA